MPESEREFSPPHFTDRSQTQILQNKRPREQNGQCGVKKKTLEITDMITEKCFKGLTLNLVSI